MSDTTGSGSADYSSWAVGWAGFAGVMLVLMGLIDAVQGLVAIIEEEFYVVGHEWVFQFNVTTRGWIHLIFGVVLVLSGIGIFSGNVAARTVGVIAASLAILANFAWLPYYPVWSITLIGVGIAIIWAPTFLRDGVQSRRPLAASSAMSRMIPASSKSFGV